MASRKPDVDTRAALIEATWALLCERGLANTSVNAILERAGLSKGTFYHWFKSRTALLDAVAEHVLNVALANSRAHVAQAGSGLERLRVFLSAGRAWRLRNAPGYRALSQALYDPANQELLERVRARTNAVARAELQAILEQGARDGSLQVAEPELLAEYIVETGQALADLQLRDLLRGEGLDRVVRRASLHLRWLEQGLGLPAGVLSELGDDFRAGVAQLMPPEENP